MMGVFLVVVYATTMYWYAGSVILQNMSILYFVPLFNGLLAYYDQTGRVTSMNAALVSVGTTAAPFLAGMVLNAGGSFVMLGWMSAAFFLLIIACSLKPALKADRNANNDPADMMGTPTLST